MNIFFARRNANYAVRRPKSTFSAYEVKNNCCLFERLFRVKKNGVFLFGIYFFVVEIFTFLYYANDEVMTSWVVPLKQHNTQSSITLEISRQCSSNLAPVMYIKKET